MWISPVRHPKPAIATDPEAAWDTPSRQVSWEPPNPDAEQIGGESVGNTSPPDYAGAKKSKARISSRACSRTTLAYNH
jgi:hypothetical protein